MQASLGWQLSLRGLVIVLPWLVVLVGLWPGAVNAADIGAIPWQETLIAIRDSFCGPVAHYAITIAIVLSGLLVAFGELQGLFATLLRVLMGASLALMSVRFLGMFGFGSPECTVA